MNVYDFDNTILKGDSEYKFFKYMFFKKHINIKYLFIAFNAHLKSRKGKIGKEASREIMYRFLTQFKKEEIESFVIEMWEKESKNIKDFYLKQQKEDDVISSATPRFILTPICKKLGIKNLIASEYDYLNNKMLDLLNYNEQKVNSFKKIFDVNKIDEFYSDSDSDAPLAKLAKKAYKVKGNKITIWKFKE